VASGEGGEVRLRLLIRETYQNGPDTCGRRYGTVDLHVMLPQNVEDKLRGNRHDVEIIGVEVMTDDEVTR
jgi:hypothetical protein